MEEKENQLVRELEIERKKIREKDRQIKNMIE